MAGKMTTLSRNFEMRPAVGSIIPSSGCPLFMCSQRPLGPTMRPPGETALPELPTLDRVFGGLHNVIAVGRSQCRVPPAIITRLVLAVASLRPHS